MKSRAHALACVLPPYLARKLAQHPDARVRDRALHSLAVSARFRGMREVLSLLPTLTPAGVKHRTIFTANGTMGLPGQLIRHEGNPPTGDPAADEAYDGLGRTYDFYAQVFHRNSLNDKGMRLDATVHFGLGYDNAMWDGRQMIFGDGDGVLFQRFTVCLDVIAHELTHGVTSNTSNLEYYKQSGALNESCSDVFGSLVKQWAVKQDAAAADWLIGAGLLMPGVRGRALRSMLEPGTAYDDPYMGKDPQPAHMQQYVEMEEDSGGVHINSGIPNRAFALAARAIGGKSWEGAGPVWYRTLLQLHPTAQFQEAADLTYQIAGAMHGAGSAQQRAVADAWRQVGIGVTQAAARAPQATMPQPAAAAPGKLSDWSGLEMIKPQAGEPPAWGKRPPPGRQ